jgi:hypothetical protein
MAVLQTQQRLMPLRAGPPVIMGEQVVGNTVVPPRYNGFYSRPEMDVLSLGMILRVRDHGGALEQDFPCVRILDPAGHV